MFGFKKKTVRVQFFEQGAPEPFAVSDMPLEQLPESFAIDTMMHIGEDNWSVVRAEPSLRAEVAEHGRLDLHLNKVIHPLPEVQQGTAKVWLDLGEAEQDVPEQPLTIVQI